MDSATLKKLLEKDGWFLDRVKGSHHQFKHSKKTGSNDVTTSTKKYSKRYGEFNHETGRVKIALS